MIRSRRLPLDPRCARFQAVSSASGGAGGGDLIRVLGRNNTFQIRSLSCMVISHSTASRSAASPLQQLVDGVRLRCGGDRNIPPRPLWPRSSLEHTDWYTVPWSRRRFAVSTTSTHNNSNDHNVDAPPQSPPPPEPPLVRFYCCFTSHDLDEVLELRPDYSQLETVASFDAPIDDVNEIQASAQQYFASSRLEYWSLGRWKPINNLAYDLFLLADSSTALKQEIPVTLAIRDPDQFGTSDVPAPDDKNDDFESNEAFGSSKRASEMENTICFLVDCLKCGGYRRASDTHLYYPQSRTSSADTATTTPSTTTDSDNDDDTTIATRDWILHHARDDEELRMALLDYPHALEHIAECLHFDFLWSSSASAPSLDDDGDDSDAGDTMPIKSNSTKANGNSV
jgi:hypothetical protein